MRAAKFSPRRKVDVQKRWNISTRISSREKDGPIKPLPGNKIEFQHIKARVDDGMQGKILNSVSRYSKEKSSKGNLSTAHGESEERLPTKSKENLKLSSASITSNRDDSNRLNESEKYELIQNANDVGKRVLETTSAEPSSLPIDRIC